MTFYVTSQRNGVKDRMGRRRKRGIEEDENLVNDCAETEDILTWPLTPSAVSEAGPYHHPTTNPCPVTGYHIYPKYLGTLTPYHSS